MTHEGFVFFCGLSVFQMLRVAAGISGECECAAARISSHFPSAIPMDTCCLNFSGSIFNKVPWADLVSQKNLQILDLSSCNISHIDHRQVSDLSLLRELYLGRNRLMSLPHDFLEKAYNLQVLDLGENDLKDLPERFLQSSNKLQNLLLGWNQLTSIPHSVLKPSLQRLELSGNPLACTCSLWEGLQSALQNNSTTYLQVLIGNYTCTSPKVIAGRILWTLQTTEVCRLANLTALFILLPLFFLFSLVLCWCCGQKPKKKETLSFSPSRKKHNSSHCNGRWPHAKLATGNPAASVNSGKDVVLGNQLILQPSSSLQGSTRDIYEEVEIKLGSVDSLAPAPSSCSTEGTVGKQDLDALSVSEVMKDSAVREKAYLTQSTEYYSLVPGIEIEDSDHGEYENVDLS